jgi:tetratricopeptide (TPR) repeat protein
MTRWVSIAVSFFVLASSAAAQGPAAASPPGQAAPAAQPNAGGDDYKQLIAEALVEFDAHRYEEARALFLRAHALSPNARTLRALGNVEFELRHYARAARYLREALASRAHALTPQMQAEAQQALSRALSYTGRFQLDLQPPGAVLTIDGEAPALEPDGSLLLDIGRTELTLSAPGYATEHKVVTVEGGEDERLEIGLLRSEVASPAASAAGTGTAPRSPADDGASASHGSVFGTWWFWTAVGVVVAGAATGVAIAASGGSETQAPLRGNLGETRAVLTIAP